VTQLQVRAIAGAAVLPHGNIPHRIDQITLSTMVSPGAFFLLGAGEGYSM